MSWAKVSGDYAFNRKVLIVGNEGAGAHVRMIAWAAENLTGGKLPRAAALTIAPQPLIDRLVEVGLLDVDDEGWAVHDYGDHNPTGEDLAARRAELRAKRAEYGRRGAAALWSKRDGKGTGKPNGNLPSVGSEDGKADGKNMATSPFPSPSLVPVTVPAHPSGEGSLSLVSPEAKPSVKGKRATKSHVPGSETPAADLEAWCSRHGIPSPTKNPEVARMIDHYRGTGEAKSDWGAVWRNWERRAQDFGSRNGAKVHNPVQPAPTGGSAWKSQAKERVQ